VAYTGLFYNKAIFSELGLSVPKTWAEFIAVCEAVKADGKYLVLSAGAADQWPLNMFSNAIISANYQDGAKEIGQKLLTGELKHTDPEIKLVYDCMEQFASYLEPGVTGISYSDAPGRFALGVLAMYADGAWSAADINRAEPEFEYGYFPLPGVNPRADGLDPQYGIKYDLSLSVPTNAPAKEGAFAVLEYISRPEVYTAFLNAIGMTPTQDVTLDNAFLNSLADGLKAPCINAEMYIYAPKGVGEYGSDQFSFLKLNTLGGPVSAEELAKLADEDFDTARAAIEALGN
jgi:raffinose/stachyose/melibiose transport system substrate-binding protein